MLLAPKKLVFPHEPVFGKKLPTSKLVFFTPPPPPPPSAPRTAGMTGCDGWGYVGGGGRGVGQNFSWCTSASSAQKQTYRAILQRFRALLQRHQALLRKHTCCRSASSARTQIYRAHLRRYRALFYTYWTLLQEHT